MCKFIEVVCS